MIQDNEKTVDSKDLYIKFVDEIAEFEGEEYIRKCFACGTCTATCPVRAVDSSFDPRKIIRMVVLGMKREIFESDFVWLCAGCHACSDRCPQGVKVSDIMVILRNLALKEGFVHRSYKLQVAELLKYGRLYEVGPYNKKRAKINLPPLKDDPLPVMKIMELTGLSKFICDADSGKEK